MLNPEYTWGENVITRSNPVNLFLRTSFDRILSKPSNMAISVTPAEGFQTDEQVVLHPRFGLAKSGHWHFVEEAGRDVLLREHDILHIKDAEGKIVKRMEIAIFPVDSANQ